MKKCMGYFRLEFHKEAFGSMGYWSSQYPGVYGGVPEGLNGQAYYDVLYNSLGYGLGSGHHNVYKITMEQLSSALTQPGKTVWSEFMMPGFTHNLVLDKSDTFKGIPFDLLGAAPSTHDYFSVEGFKLGEQLHGSVAFEQLRLNTPKPFVTIDQIPLSTEDICRGIVYDDFAVGFLDSDGYLEKLYAFTDLTRPGDITLSDRHFFKGNYFVDAAEEPGLYVMDAFSESLIVDLNILENFNSVLDYGLNLVAGYCLCYTAWLCYYYYAKYSYSWFYDDWDSRYGLRTFLFEAKSDATKRAESEWLERERRDALTNWDGLVDKYVWASQHSLEWAYGLRGYSLHYMELLSNF